MIGQINMNFLGENQVAVLDYETRQVDIITIPDMSELENLEERLEELGYNVNSIAYMS